MIEVGMGIVIIFWSCIGFGLGVVLGVALGRNANINR
jgi:hypothetical protein